MKINNLLFAALSFIAATSCALEPSDPMQQSIEMARTEVGGYAQNNPAVLQMFDETMQKWHQYYLKKNGAFNLQLLLDAAVYSAKKHESQIRKDADSTPYIIHPIGVARSLFEEGQVRSINVLAAALLHDTLEDTDATGEEIEALFGTRVRKTVEELTNDPNLTTEENKQRQVNHAPQLSLNAQLVKLSDRLYNVRDLAQSPPPNWDQSYILKYVEWGQKLLDALRGTNEPLEDALENEIHQFIKN